jgi:predicted nucleotidyltransferase/DNA-binding transcriptional ArsR family regulator
MRATNTVETILGSRSRVRVLRELRGVRVPLNASQIAARTKLSQPAVAAVLRDLSRMGLVQSSPAGRAWVHTLVRENAYVQRMVDAVFAAEATIPDEILAELADRFSADAVSIVLFGSYARGDQGPDSDIDLVLVGRDAVEKARLRASFDSQEPELRRRYGAPFSAVVYDAVEAEALWRRAPTLQAELETDGIVVSGLAPRAWREDAEEE